MNSVLTALTETFSQFHLSVVKSLCEMNHYVKKLIKHMKMQQVNKLYKEAGWKLKEQKDLCFQLKLILTISFLRACILKCRNVTQDVNNGHLRSIKCH